MINNTNFTAGHRLFAKKTVCEILGIHPRTFDRLVKKGKLKCKCPSARKKYVLEPDLLEYINGNDH